MRQQASAVGIGLSEGMRSGAPFSDAQIATQREMLQESEQALAVAINGVKSERKSTAVGAAIIGAFIGYMLADLSGAVVVAGIGYVYVSARSNPLTRMKSSNPTEQESAAARAQDAFERDGATLAEMERQLAAHHRANPS